MQRKRSPKGSAISEFGPALMVLFLVTLFPMINLIYLAAGYAAAWYLNHMESRELAVRAPAQASRVLEDVDKQFIDSGLAKFIKLQSTKIQHTGPTYEPSTEKPEFVALTTGVEIPPFFTVGVPGLDKVPGVGAPITFTATARRSQEEKGQD
jgi:hypothetical protein